MKDEMQYDKRMLRHSHEAQRAGYSFQCAQLFGPIIGIRLSRAIRKIQEKDFCVIPGNTENEIAVSGSYNRRARVFTLTSDYQSLYMPDGRVRGIDELQYTDIEKHLPTISFDGGQSHMDFFPKPIEGNKDDYRTSWETQTPRRIGKPSIN